ncbi:MAG: SAM-dependent methyltransferase [Burkholderiaceae bacterium]|nr:SAM-dependent methyltransferase [Burkholderiaceae bacterium]
MTQQPNGEGADSVSARAGALGQLIRRAIVTAGGWLPFDRFMALALYAPGLGYYARGSRQFGSMPASGSDFVTAPELSPLFGASLARQVGQALAATATEEIWEFGAGSGVLASQLLQALGDRVQRYTIVDLSGALRARQRETLAPFGQRVRWLDALPATMHGVVVGNEVLDAMPVQLLHWDGTTWFERGVVFADEAFGFADRATPLRPPVAAAFVPGATTEIHPQAEAFVRTLADRLEHGAAFFIDYGFPEAEYYLPERVGGTLMCHRAHVADTDPLADIGDKDITAHVNFSAIALTAQDAGFEVLGYTSQARFLLNCGLASLMGEAQQRSDWPALASAQKLLAEHEMGELFKVIGLLRGAPPFDAIGFAAGDRSHRL